MKSMNYRQLDEFLRSLGFAFRLENGGKTRVYEHPETGALVSMPKHPARNKVYPHDLVGVHMTLEWFGIPEPESFAALATLATRGRHTSDNGKAR